MKDQTSTWAEVAHLWHTAAAFWEANHHWLLVVYFGITSDSCKNVSCMNVPADFFQMYHVVHLVVGRCHLLESIGHFSAWDFYLEVEELFVLAKKPLVALSQLQILHVWHKVCQHFLTWVVKRCSGEEGGWEGSDWKHWPFSFIRQEEILVELGCCLCALHWVRAVPKCICTRGQR